MLLLNKNARYKFLNENGGGYYMVKYKTFEEPLYFNSHGNNKHEKWWLEAPCYLRKFENYDINNTNDLECIEDYGLIIFNNEVYEIDLPQVAPFLPEHVEMRKITEIECLEWLILKFK